MVRNITLASASPRREELLRQIGIHPVVTPVHVDETTVDPHQLLKNGSPRDKLPQIVCLERTRLKMSAAISVAHDGLILAADTVVALDGTLFDKPLNRTEAKEMLTALAGRTHAVYTAVIVAAPASDTIQEEVARTDVTFTPISAAEIEWYIQSEEWRGVAGGYRIQGRAAAFVERIEGTYSTVMGLPINIVYSMIKRLSS